MMTPDLARKSIFYDGTDHLMIILSSKAQGPLYLSPPPLNLLPQI